MRKHLLCCLCLIAGISGASFGATFYVAQTGDNQNDGLEWGAAKLSIQAAIDGAADGDYILVSNGTYTAAGNHVVSITKSLIIESVNGPDVTIIDGEDERRCVLVNTPGNPAALSGFAVTRGSDKNGAGIYKTNERDFYLTNCLIYANQSTGSGGGILVKSQMFVRDCVISNNTAENYGGGIYANAVAGLYLYDCEIVHNSAIQLSGGGIYATAVAPDAGVLVEAYRCRIAGNSAHSGGGVQFVESVAPEATASLNDCVIENNSAHTGGGGGIFRGSNGESEFLISNCIIRGNTSPYSSDQTGAGIRFDGACRIVGCLIVGNQGTSDKTYAGGVAIRSGGKRSAIENTTIAYNVAGRYGAGIHARPEVTDCSIQNCIIYGNVAPNDADAHLMSGAQLQFKRSCLGVGLNIPPEADVFYSDPLFRDPDNGDYRLLSGSPCINAGIKMPWMENAVDLDGYRRLDCFSKLADIGCYEYMPEGVLFRLK